VWKTPTGGAIVSSPGVVNGLVSVGLNDGALDALDAATGQIVMKTLTGGALCLPPTS
jgi:outer membrane protein assembly factor BamB